MASNFDGYKRILADGSKIEKTVGAGAVLALHSSNKQVRNHSSIFTADARAIL